MTFGYKKSDVAETVVKVFEKLEYLTFRRPQADYDGKVLIQWREKRIDTTEDYVSSILVDPVDIAIECGIERLLGDFVRTIAFDLDEEADR